MVIIYQFELFRNSVKIISLFSCQLVIPIGFIV